MNPTIKLAVSVQEATSLVCHALTAHEFRVVRSFDLKQAAGAHPHCICEHHGTAYCTCQYLLLMAYPPPVTLEGAMTIALHSHAGMTLVSLIDGDETRWLNLMLPVITSNSIGFPNKENEMTSKHFSVPNISCGHCTHTIKMELGELPGIKDVQAEIDSKTVTVEWDAPATWDQIKSVLTEINFPPAE